MQLQKSLDEFKKSNIQVVGISYDNVDILKKFSERAKLNFDLLSDEGSKTIRELEIEDRKGLPHSGTILVDKNKKVKAKIFYKGYKKRHANDVLMDAAKFAGMIKS